MANIFLDPNDTFTLTSSNTDDSVFGRPGGGETVIIQGAPTGTKLDGNIETVQIAATAAGTTLQINATTGQLEIVSGGVVIGTFSSGLNQSVTLKFSDGDVTLTQTGANSFSIADAANPGTSATVDGANPQTGGAVLANNPTLTVTAAAASVNEGDTATFNVATTNVAAGSTVSYVIGGNAANSANQADVTGPLTGTATVGADGKATISVAVTSDNVTEGSETLTLTAVTGQLSSTANTTINDTSLSPAALTTADDTLTGGAGDDAYSGVSSALSSERTLNPGDKIDGGAGNDTLNVDMKGAFGGFSSTGFLKNVENVNLTNTGTIAREFDASGVTGVQTYKLNGAVSLRDLDSAATGVTVENRDTGTVTIDYADDAIKGTSDTLALGVNGLGTAAVPASTGVTGSAEQAVTIDVTSNTGSVETAAIKASGISFVTLGTNVGTKAITVSGDGTLALRGVANGVTTFDGSTATGNLAVDFANTADVTSIKGGAGNDGFAVTDGDLQVNAAVEGGAGADTLALNGQVETVQLAMSGVETIAVSGATTFTYSGTNTSGVEKISTTASGGTATFANFGGADLAFDLNGTSKGVILSDNSGAATINVVKPASDANNTDKATANDTDVTLSKAGQVALTVADKMDYTGTITATEATSVTAAIKGQTTNAVINAGKAQSVVITEVTGDASTLTLTAGTAKSVEVTNAKNLALKDNGLTTNSDLSKVETFSSSGAGNITTGDLGAANQVNVSNSGAVEIGNVGSATQDYSANVTVSGSGKTDIANVKTKDQSIVVSASNLTGAFQVIDINAGTGNVNVTAQTTGTATVGAVTGKDVTVDLGNVLSSTSTGVISASGNVSYTGATLKANAADATVAAPVAQTVSINLTGTAATQTVALKTGLEKDTVAIANNGNGTKTITVTGDLGTQPSGQEDIVSVTGGTGNDTISIAGVSGYESATLNGGTGADKLTGGAGKDVIIVDDADTLVDGGAGQDTLNLAADVAFTAAELANVEVAIATVEGADLTVASADVKGANNIASFTGVTGGTAEKLIVKGTAGADTLDYSSGLTLTNAQLQVDASDGNDNVTGTGGDDILNGDGGDDRLIGGSGNDVLNGGAGNDVVVGGDGNDSINGGGAASGRDVMAGLSGNDTVDATNGAIDEIHFRSIDGSDTINSFSFTEDKIHFLDNGNLTGGSVDFAGFADTTAGAAGTDFAAAQEIAGLYVEVADATAFGAAAAVNGAVFVINADGVNGMSVNNGDIKNAYVLVDAGAALEVYFDSDWTDNTGREKVMTLVGVADTSQVDVTDFGIYTTA